MIQPLREDIARRFPLVARPRPCCHPLDVRVRQVANLADASTCDDPDEAAASAASAAQALNFAALIASDCGLPDLAADLCHRQFALFGPALPLDAATAKLALQPLINLGVLHARTGDSTAAHHLIDSLFHAVSDQAHLRLGGLTADFDDLTRTPDDHREVVGWLWKILLADGSRALAQAKRWDRALQLLRQHHGIGQTLLDGRQIAIIAHHATGDAASAAHLLDSTPTPTLWEAAVLAALTALTGRDIPAAALADRYLALDDALNQVVFRTRLGLVLLDLSSDEPDPRLTEAIHTDVRRAKDAYAARDLLAHPRSATLVPASSRDELSDLVKAAGLGYRTMPTELLSRLTATTAAAEASLSQVLSHRDRAPVAGDG